MIAAVFDRHVKQIEADLNQKLHQERAFYMDALDCLKKEFEQKMHNLVMFFTELAGEVRDECPANSTLVQDIIELAAGSLSAQTILALKGEGTKSPSLLSTPTMSLPTSKMATQEFIFDIERRIIALETLLDNRPKSLSVPDNTDHPFVQHDGSTLHKEGRDKPPGVLPTYRSDTWWIAQAQHAQKQKKDDKNMRTQGTRRKLW